MPFDNSKYDLELAGLGLRISNYRKSETSTFIPRFGAGSQNESEFDLVNFYIEKSYQERHHFYVNKTTSDAIAPNCACQYRVAGN